MEVFYKGTVAKSIQYRGSEDLSGPEREALEAIIRAIFAAVEKNQALTDFFAATDIVVLEDSDSSNCTTFKALLVALSRFVVCYE